LACALAITSFHVQKYRDFLRKIHVKTLAMSGASIIIWVNDVPPALEL